MEKSLFLQKHSASIRIWHWVVFLTISFIMLTVLFESTMFNPRDNTGMVINILKEKKLDVTTDQARAVAHEYGDKLWILHKYLGFGLAFLILSRVVIELTISDEEKMRKRIKSALTLQKQARSDESNVKLYIVVRYTYIAFYLLILFMATTGLLIAFGANLGISREGHHTLKEIHGFGQYLMYTFVFFHLCGVVVADLRNSRGIISGMVNGGE